jgi:hypothetical protein
LQSNGDVSFRPKAAQEAVSGYWPERQIHLATAAEHESRATGLKLPTGVQVLAEPGAGILGDSDVGWSPDRRIRDPL